LVKKYFRANPLNKTKPADCSTGLFFDLTISEMQRYLRIRNFVLFTSELTKRNHRMIARQKVRDSFNAGTGRAGVEDAETKSGESFISSDEAERCADLPKA
jgi:hypothetical protein